MKGTKHLPAYIAFLLIPQGIWAQDLDRVMPERLPQQLDRQSEADGSGIPQLRQLGAARDGETVVLPELKGILVVASEAELQLNPDVAGVTVSVPALQGENTDILNDVFIGEPASMESLDRIVESLRFSMASVGRPFSLSYLPEQDITSGVVQFVVQQSTLSSIRVEGNEYFSEASYLKRLPLVRNDSIDADRLNTGLERINQNPFRQASVTVGRGEEPATTAVVINAQEIRPLQFFTGFNNSGTTNTGAERYSAGVNWGNVFGTGHRMSLQWTSDLQSQHSRAISGNYQMDLPNADQLTVFGAYSEIESEVPFPLQQQGKSYQLGADVNHAFERIGDNYQHSLRLGMDYKVSDNNLDYVLPPFIFAVTNNETQIVQARATYQATLNDSRGYTQADIGLVVSPGGLTSKNSDEAFANTRFNASADYAYATLDIRRETQLQPQPNSWRWRVNAGGQLSNRNLLGSEQYSAGGNATVRGYEEGEVIGDNAIFLNQELAMPALSILVPGLAAPGSIDSLSLYAFQDNARTWNHDRLPGEEAFKLASVGVGLRYQYLNNLSAAFSYGWQLLDSGSSREGENSAAHFSLRLSF
ncbi:ShlB/FhaC/HecB family hemolysin secretion/activation protein [Pseudohongiella acticola]|jgi:hemolysin activation/secretion protein|uniref:ShlB/FhaC/HecB family hemolysin secretion/activation protein n=1 Tax=Pseudohongiella acticola TaxID=1524254 RepID=UPI0030ED1884